MSFTLFPAFCLAVSYFSELSADPGGSADLSAGPLWLYGSPDTLLHIQLAISFRARHLSYYSPQTNPQQIQPHSFFHAISDIINAVSFFDACFVLC